MQKLCKWLVQLLVSIDQLLHVLFWGPFYVLFRGQLPKADETISSKVGRKAVEGKKWALLLEKPINFVFRILGEDNHCRKRIEWDEF